ncbi:hypothetical protein Nepgr_002871 [Nepenthes gracilis]|uniref:ubiquitinyl hydrolase 1 n=1 Tax=Nepenthes gracilis TaxID=150966 RepID=A0AAD3P7W4_NEPGR|nr:hypothetical protein Nepgr_002871 [Nepenthes gracilis]
MADHEEEDLLMASRMSMQNSHPGPKRSKPRDEAAAPMSVGTSVEESPEAKSRRLQRELMAAAAEKRMMAAKSTAAAAGLKSDRSRGANIPVRKEEKFLVDSGKELSVAETNQLFSMVFGGNPSKEILAQWTNQGIRFSPDLETSMGLVQHEGGPCGVLAAIQAFVLKYLLFVPEGSSNPGSRPQQNLGSKISSETEDMVPNVFSSLTEHARKRALVRSMGEILFRCGNSKRSVVATMSILGNDAEGASNGPIDEIIAKALGGISIESASDLQKSLRINTYMSCESAYQRLEAMIPVFQSRMGAMLFLISALLSRGLDSVQADRDDPSLPLVTAPFGHASQEIVNLLLCGQAVANVFDERMDLGGGLFIKGISTSVEVGFLSLLESLNFCKVGEHLKCPKWPIWVVGSDSHYTVLFALEPSVQDENIMEARESEIRRAFDNQDQSGGGGFISVEGFHQVIKETNITLLPEKMDHLCSTGFIVWSEFWQVLLDLDRNHGGLKDSNGSMGRKVFDLYHFNGIAKSVSNGNHATSEGETPAQRPRLTKLRVSVPPRWTPEQYMADVRAVSSSSGRNETNEKEAPAQAAGPEAEPPQHAQLVDCIRTRWPRADCYWTGDPPSIV